MSTTDRLETIIAGGSIATGSSPAAKIRCADGFTVSVQASWGHYSTDSADRRPQVILGGIRRGAPQDDAVLPYTTVELGYPSLRPEPWDKWSEYAESPESPTSTVYGYVPVGMVRELIASHGGESR